MTPRPALVADGEDPAVVKRTSLAELQLRHLSTFNAVADEYVERLKLQCRAESTITKNIWLFDQVRPTLGRRLMLELRWTMGG